MFLSPLQPLVEEHVKVGGSRGAQRQGFREGSLPWPQRSSLNSLFKSCSRQQTRLKVTRPMSSSCYRLPIALARLRSVGRVQTVHPGNPRQTKHVTPINRGVF